ncbi:SIR2 family protein [Bradyrhizobium sp. HKCCYLRH3099]|uniref:SIR2 family protein n=1 Tax=unclassified Bradyrhizobium TaxID=2631580 RepID=UPI003EBCABFC
MPIALKELVGRIRPRNTVLFFGSGSSIPSGACSAKDLATKLGEPIGLDAAQYSLSELAALYEGKRDRKALINVIRANLGRLRPTGGLVNLPNYPWKSLFTTNYDQLIEEVYKKASEDLNVYSSNFDFTMHDQSASTKLFKLHGTVEKDISDGYVGRLIITDTDYDHTQDYRQRLYDRLRSDVAGAHLIIIGHSLSDPNIKDEVARAVDLNSEVDGSGRITLLLYTRDETRAVLYEKRGIEVCFCGIDDFFAELLRQQAPSVRMISSEDPLDQIPGLHPVTVDVRHSVDLGLSNFANMFAGWPATYAEIEQNLTFQRSLSDELETYLDGSGVLAAVIVGASGVGKTTAARQLQLRFLSKDNLCWEHRQDQPLSVDLWGKMMELLRQRKQQGFLFIDNAHMYLHELNELIDHAVATDNAHLKLVLASNRNHWYPRVKTPNLYKYSREWVLSKLTLEEVERLLQLVDSNEIIRKLVEPQFSGFSRHERRRRLVERCEKDFFVCLRNIFASESLDDIVLREFADLGPIDQDIYRYVAAMESAGIRVHRQLVVRLLGLPISSIPAVLQNLLDVVHEDDVDVIDGIFIWRTRHPVIASIITKYKFSDKRKTIDLFDKVIDGINPTYDIEVRTIRELCNIETGLPSIAEKSEQNRLLRKMMSIAPGERVPRHRLIRNLIEQGEFEKAETEIRIFNKDFGPDGPVHRYKVTLMVARAVRTQGIMDEDRITILEQARELAVAGCDRYPNNKNMLSAYADLGIEYYRRTGRYEFYDDAIKKLKLAEDRIGDPDISKIILRFERRLAGKPFEDIDNG